MPSRKGRGWRRPDPSTSTPDEQAASNDTKALAPADQSSSDVPGWKEMRCSRSVLLLPHRNDQARCIVVLEREADEEGAIEYMDTSASRQALMDELRKRRSRLGDSDVQAAYEWAVYQDGETMVCFYVVIVSADARERFEEAIRNSLRLELFEESKYVSNSDGSIKIQGDAVETSVGVADAISSIPSLAIDGNLSEALPTGLMSHKRKRPPELVKKAPSDIDVAKERTRMWDRVSATINTRRVDAAVNTNGFPDQDERGPKTATGAGSNHKEETEQKPEQAPSTEQDLPTSLTAERAVEPTRLPDPWLRQPPPTVGPLGIGSSIWVARPSDRIPHATLPRSEASHITSVKEDEEDLAGLLTHNPWDNRRTSAVSASPVDTRPASTRPASVVYSSDHVFSPLSPPDHAPRQPPHPQLSPIEGQTARSSMSATVAAFHPAATPTSPGAHGPSSTHTQWSGPSHSRFGSMGQWTAQDLPSQGPLPRHQHTHSVGGLGSVAIPAGHLYGNVPPHPPVNISPTALYPPNGQPFIQPLPPPKNFPPNLQQQQQYMNAQIPGRSMVQPTHYYVAEQSRELMRHGVPSSNMPSESSSWSYPTNLALLPSPLSNFNGARNTVPTPHHLQAPFNPPNPAALGQPPPMPFNPPFQQRSNIAQPQILYHTPPLPDVKGTIPSYGPNHPARPIKPSVPQASVDFAPAHGKAIPIVAPSEESPKSGAEPGKKQTASQESTQAEPQRPGGPSSSSPTGTTTPPTPPGLSQPSKPAVLPPAEVHTASGNRTNTPKPIPVYTIPTRRADSKRMATEPARDTRPPGAPIRAIPARQSYSVVPSSSGAESEKPEPEVSEQSSASHKSVTAEKNGGAGAAKLELTTLEPLEMLPDAEPLSPQKLTAIPDRSQTTQTSSPLKRKAPAAASPVLDTKAPDDTGDAEQHARSVGDFIANEEAQQLPERMEDESLEPLLPTTPVREYRPQRPGTNGADTKKRSASSRYIAAMSWDELDTLLITTAEPVKTRKLLTLEELEAAAASVNAHAENGLARSRSSGFRVTVNALGLLGALGQAADILPHLTPRLVEKFLTHVLNILEIGPLTDVRCGLMTGTGEGMTCEALLLADGREYPNLWQDLEHHLPSYLTLHRPLSDERSYVQ